MPFTSSGFFQWSRTWRIRSQLTVSRPPRMLRDAVVVASIDGRLPWSVFSMRGTPPFSSVLPSTDTSQRGWLRPSKASFGVSLSGSEKPVRRLISRLEFTATSVVTMRIS